MAVFVMHFAFNGSAYSGWQRQNGLRTVQQALEDVLRSIFHDGTLAVTACGRTDSGVHALDMTASFRTEKELPEKELTALLENRLPHDMRLLSISKAQGDFNAHKNALGKAYIYVISPGKPNLFLRGLCWNWADVPLTGEVGTALKILPGTHDFRFFTGRHAPGGTIRTLYRAELLEFGSLVCFYFSGNGFLYKMVRRLTGFLYEIAQGKRDAEDLAAMLENPSVPPDDLTVAPPDGLYLKKVFYAPDEWRQDRLETLPFLC